jgi:hypothetical protein
LRARSGRIAILSRMGAGRGCGVIDEPAAVWFMYLENKP